MSSFWNFCTTQFENELPTQQFNTWIKPLRLEGEEDLTGGLRLVAPNGFIQKWVRDRYGLRIAEMAVAFFGNAVAIEVVVGARQNAPSPVKTASNVASVTSSPAPARRDEASAEPRKAAPARVESPRAASAYDKSRLIPGFTFDNLIVGKANDLARAAATRVATDPGGAQYNPLFIYGGAGLGKTHLIHAIGNQISDNFPDKVVRYVHAEDYYSDVVRAYQQKSFDVFKRYYRSLDVLLLDDVQFFNNKNRTQEEFFYVFNALIEARKQIVISCDTYPKDISGLEDRLITRFDWGLTVQIEPPETEMRVAILKKKAESEGVALDDEVAFFIAKHLRSNVRELEGALKKVLAYASFHCRSIELELAKEALKDMIGAFNRQITVENIQKTVADYYKIKVADLFSKKRTRVIARPRQVAMWLAKDLTSQSYPAIGDAFGGRDHTTVLHAVRTIESLRAKDNELNHDLHVLQQVLKG
ncbi:chromosomal replication initiator protein DnaA [Rhodocyclus tenuis]|uniref:chromosomal replication initiator protein DnaA n=1 Tax=Rhodocyclus gracilis TaxID=2929842 RepID=UPI001298B3CF|nr:chromosomal replication initiator protein DnaA [Rhodocyclus gracilis]MRD73542.1 chromosomal replication initiator protein DnaA [Rhodocyclus gracilis]